MDQEQIKFSCVSDPEKWPEPSMQLSASETARLLNLAIELAEMVLEDERLERAHPKTAAKAFQVLETMWYSKRRAG